MKSLFFEKQQKNEIPIKNNDELTFFEKPKQQQKNETLIKNEIKNIQKEQNQNPFFEIPPPQIEIPIKNEIKNKNEKEENLIPFFEIQTPIKNEIKINNEKEDNHNPFFDLSPVQKQKIDIPKNQTNQREKEDNQNPFQQKSQPKNKEEKKNEIFPDFENQVPIAQQKNKDEKKNEIFQIDQQNHLKPTKKKENGSSPKKENGFNQKKNEKQSHIDSIQKLHKNDTEGIENLNKHLKKNKLEIQKQIPENINSSPEEQLELTLVMEDKQDSHENSQEENEKVEDNEIKLFEEENDNNSVLAKKSIIDFPPVEKKTRKRRKRKNNNNNNNANGNHK